MGPSISLEHWLKEVREEHNDKGLLPSTYASNETTIKSLVLNATKILLKITTMLLLPPFPPQLLQVQCLHFVGSSCKKILFLSALVDLFTIE